MTNKLFENDHYIVELAEDTYNVRNKITNIVEESISVYPMALEYAMILSEKTVEMEQRIDAHNKKAARASIKVVEKPH